MDLKDLLANLDHGQQAAVVLAKHPEIVARIEAALRDPKSSCTIGVAGRRVQVTINREMILDEDAGFVAPPPSGN